MKHVSMKTVPGLIAALTLAVAANDASAKLRGIDVSNNNGSVTWSSVYNAGIRFAITKATEGDYFQDSYYHANMQHGKSQGINMGAYHFARPDLNDGNHEASYFYSYASSEFGTGGNTLQPVLDLEIWNGGHVGATSFTDWANQFADTLTTKMNNAGMTHNTLVYGSACNVCNYNSNIKGHSWIANYNGEDPDTGTPWSVCSSCNVWGGWTFWQYTATGSVSGVSGNCDRDVYNGTLADLEASIYIVNKR
ncbi:MAG: glycoside hydrolase family 25 protein [Limisphaerales bacterium]